MVWLMVVMSEQSGPAQVAPKRDLARVATFDWHLAEINKDFVDGWIAFEWDDGRTYEFRLQALSVIQFYPAGHELGRQGHPSLVLVAAGQETRIDLAPGSKLPADLFDSIKGIESLGEITITKDVQLLDDE